MRHGAWWMLFAMSDADTFTYYEMTPQTLGDLLKAAIYWQFVDDSEQDQRLLTTQLKAFFAEMHNILFDLSKVDPTFCPVHLGFVVAQQTLCRASSDLDATKWKDLCGELEPDVSKLNALKDILLTRTNVQSGFLYGLKGKRPYEQFGEMASVYLAMNRKLMNLNAPKHLMPAVEVLRSLSLDAFTLAQQFATEDD